MAGAAGTTGPCSGEHLDRIAMVRDPMMPAVCFAEQLYRIARLRDPMML
jgi:hypothetical protein